MKLSNFRKFKYSIIIISIVILISSMACSNKVVKIKSIADSSMGYWIKNSDSIYNYKISNANKEKIYRNEINNTEKTRNNKMMLGIMYILDIDNTFMSIGDNSFNLDLQSKDTLIIGKENKYLIIFEEYKSIYFPISIEIIKK